MKHQGIREIFRIIEWKDSCVYRTRSEGLAWVTFDHVSSDKDIQFVAVSQKQMPKGNIGVRTVSDNTPDIVMLETKE